MKYAYKYYKMCVKIDNLNTPAILGYCQLSIFFNEALNDALSRLEQLLVKEPYPPYYAYKLSGFICSQLGSPDKAKMYYKKALEICDYDEELQLLYTQILEIDDKESAISHYQSIIDRVSPSKNNNKNNNIKPILLNNIATLFIETNQFNKARDIFKEIISGKDKNSLITRNVLYNRACLDRDEGMMEDAIAGFSKVMELAQPIDILYIESKMNKKILNNYDKNSSNKDSDQKHLIKKPLIKKFAEMSKKYKDNQTLHFLLAEK